MNVTGPAITVMTEDERARRLKAQVQVVIAAQNLDPCRELVQVVAAELNVPLLDCAAAIAYLNEVELGAAQPEKTLLLGNSRQVQSVRPSRQPGIKLVRYRLDLGTQHEATLDEIKKVLVEESGVDIKNIANVRILDSYTLIDLPDEMPQEIFHHLKTIEINGKQLDIRRVKGRSKKRGNRRHRQVRPTPTPPANGMSH